MKLKVPAAALHYELLQEHEDVLGAALREEHADMRRRRVPGPGLGLSDDCADGGAAQEQALPTERRQSLSHGRAGDTEPLDELGISVEQIPVGKVAFDDGVKGALELGMFGRATPPFNNQVLQDIKGRHSVSES